MTTILLIEDDPTIRLTTEFTLTKHGYAVSSCDNAQEGLDTALMIEPDLILLDVMLPGLNGFEVAKKLRQENVTSPILMLTALSNDEDKINGLDAGADDYMVKPFDFRELNARIKVLLKRKAEATVSVVAPEKLTYKDLQIDTNRREVMRQGSLIRLSPKEYNLLTYMVQNAERVISRIEIAEKVWNTHFDTGTNFIDVYINYLRKKIDKDFETKLIHTKPGIGFILTDEKP